MFVSHPIGRAKPREGPVCASSWGAGSRSTWLLFPFLSPSVYPSSCYPPCCCCWRRVPAAAIGDAVAAVSPGDGGGVSVVDRVGRVGGWWRWLRAVVFVVLLGLEAVVVLVDGGE